MVNNFCLLLVPYSPSVTCARDSFLFAGLRLLNMESAESPASPEPPEPLIPEEPNNIQESPTQRKLQVLFEKFRTNGHFLAFFEAYQSNSHLWSLLLRLQTEENLQALLRVYNENKHIRHLIRHQPESEPIEDYITEFKTRCQLYKKFVKCATSTNLLAKKTKSLSATVFAIIMVAPVPILQTALSDQSHRDAWLIGYFGMTEPYAAAVVKRYKPGWTMTTKLVPRSNVLPPYTVETQREDFDTAAAVLLPASIPQDLQSCALLLMYLLFHSAKLAMIIPVFLLACAIQRRHIYSLPIATHRVSATYYRFFRLFRAKIAKCDRI